MAENDYTSEDRRKLERYRPMDLRLTIAYPGIKGMLRSCPTASCTDFNTTGLQFISDRRFDLDERVVIDLCVRDERVDELTGIVCYASKVEDRYQCGVRFCLEKKHMQKEGVARVLRNIESCLKLGATFPEDPHS